MAHKDKLFQNVVDSLTIDKLLDPEGAEKREEKRSGKIKIKAKTPRGAANELVRVLKRKYDAKNIVVWSPKVSRDMGYGECWTVCWEEGPFEWARCLLGGSSIYAGEFGKYSMEGEIDVNSNPNWYVEPWNSFTLGFYKD